MNADKRSEENKKIVDVKEVQFTKINNSQKQFAIYKTICNLQKTTCNLQKTIVITKKYSIYKKKELVQIRGEISQSQHILFRISNMKNRIYCDNFNIRR